MANASVALGNLGWAMLLEGDLDHAEETTDRGLTAARDGAAS
jgi:hypothetical protein